MLSRQNINFTSLSEAHSSTQFDCFNLPPVMTPLDSNDFSNETLSKANIEICLLLTDTQ